MSELQLEVLVYWAVYSALTFAMRIAGLACGVYGLRWLGVADPYIVLAGAWVVYGAAQAGRHGAAVVVARKAGGR